ncbi:MAG: KUP/HAK/KT family potassium transporter, partial [Solirubrobacteraceae bacterium]
WHRPKRLIALGAVVFLSIEVTFFAANLTKIFHGGWLPLVIASIVFVALTTWRKGRDIVTINRSREEGPLDDFLRHLDARDFPVVRVPGTAVFLHTNPRMTPLALRANVEHNHVVHENVVILSIKNERVPHIADSDRLVADNLGDPDDRITCLTARCGFQDDTDIPATLRQADRLGLLEGSSDFDNATYFLSRITIVPSDAPGMSRWRKHLFLTMSHNAASPVEYFRLPDDRTITIGERIQL